VAKRSQLRVWGTGWEQWAEQLNWTGRPVERRDFSAVCSSSGVTLGVNPSLLRGATTCASDRMWMVLLAGGFYLGEGTPGIDRMLLDGVHCAWYTDLDSCIERIEHYLARSAEHERIRAEGERFVREHHTYDERVRHMLSGEAWVNPLG
jgi:spore maturation protein CgeB